jgi:tetratricopeptide (TPR) repeat protein
MATIEDEVRSCNQQGIALAQQGRLDEAAAWFRHAVQLKPDLPAGHNNLGNILSLQGRLTESVPCYRAALRLAPDDARALNNLGNALRQLGELDEAVSCGRRAIALLPGYAEAHSNLGIALEARGEREEALAHCREAVRLLPEFPEAHNNLGLVLNELGRFAEAVGSCREALRLRPGYAEAYNNLGTAFLRQERWDDAVACFDQALQLRPDLAMVHVGLASSFWRLDRIPEAIAHGEEALRLQPDLAPAHSVMGAICFVQGRHNEALAYFDRALRSPPGLADARFNRGLVRLLLGDLPEGWHDYEWRLQCVTHAFAPLPRPIWDGAPLAGRTILLHPEQGLGDTLQFIRYVPLVRQRGGKVIVACQPPLVSLLTSCADIDGVVPQGGAMPACDIHAPLLSLPAIFESTLATIPRHIPYLFADDDLVEHWRRELAAFPGFKVGIAWKGSSAHPLDRYRSIPLAQFAPLALDGVHLLSLQKGDGIEQLRDLAGRFAVTDLGGSLDETAGAFMDTAAVMKSLDLVITTDTAIAHLAGALGVPVWVALPFVPDWRWLLDREDSPWYPTMRLFRQKVPQRWEDVFARIAGELERLVQERPGARSIRIEVAAGELIDKITILEIKRERITDPAKIRNVVAELEVLTPARDRAIKPTPALAELTAKLKATNAVLWDIEDAIRAREQAQDFGSRFIELARSVYRENDRRSALKRQINELLGSKLMEEKSYDASQKAQG